MRSGSIAADWNGTGLHLINPEFCGTLFGCTALVELSNEAIGPRNTLGGAASYIISKQTLLGTILPLC